MSSAGDVARGRQRFAALLRSGTALRIAGLAVLVLAAVIVLALVYGDLPEYLRFGGQLRTFFRHYPYVFGFALLYIEESGVPLPAPGDVFVLYVGAHVPRNVFAWLGAWLGLIAAVTAGATNLFFVSRRFGGRLVKSPYAAYLHLNEDRVARAELWFKRWGALAIIFGRHIPGFRVPITVAAGTFRLAYPVFAVSVAISTAIWAGIVLIIGINYGPRLEAFLTLHSYMYFIWGGIVVALVAGIILRQRQEAAVAEESVERLTGR